MNFKSVFKYFGMSGVGEWCVAYVGVWGVLAHDVVSCVVVCARIMRIMRVVLGILLASCCGGSLCCL